MVWIMPYKEKNQCVIFKKGYNNRVSNGMTILQKFEEEKENLYRILR